jgi:DNA-binding LacI/PurR family transcriptional regulator
LARAFIVSSSSSSFPTIRSTADFARHLGLSRSAVSRVINNRPGLRSSTIERVRKAMEETGFTPNAHALHLRGEPTATIGVCVENFLTPTAVRKLSVLQDFLAAKDYTALIEVHRPESRQRVVQHFLSMRVDGVVFIGHFEPADLGQRLGELARHGVPHVVVDNPGLKKTSMVTLDRVAAMEGVVEHLFDLGHRRFGLLGISGPYQTVSDRLHGIEAALSRRHLDPAKALVSLDEQHPRHEHFEYGATLARSFMQLKDRPTAFIAVNDETAVGALLEFQSQGLNVPRDFSMVGFNNQNLCQMTRPLLTSVDQEIEKTMEAAMALILRQVGRTKPGAAVVRNIEPTLVVRGSTGPARERK